MRIHVLVTYARQQIEEQIEELHRLETSNKITRRYPALLIFIFFGASLSI